MSDVPRYSFVGPHSPMVQREDGAWTYYVLVGPKIQEAVTKERDRCRHEEVKPLLKACEECLVLIKLDSAMWYKEQLELVHDIRNAVNGVLRIQKEKP